MRLLRIGELASTANVSVDTVRFYERRGLLPRARRERSGYRVFDEQAIERLALVRALASMGIELDEIRAMLRAIDARRASCASEQPRLRTALGRTEARIAALEDVRRQLRATLDRCDAGECSLTGCG